MIYTFSIISLPVKNTCQAYNQKRIKVATTIPKSAILKARWNYISGSMINNKAVNVCECIMHRATVVSTQEMLTFVILILLIESQHVIAFPFIDCKNQSPLIYCPDYGSNKWNDRASCQNCADGTKYHCCKDYDSPKSNCEQDEYYCENEKYVEGCAEEKFCKQGEEPILDFVINQKWSDKPIVRCLQCYNSNRYNSHVNTSSATYSECPRKKKNICTSASHKVECGKPSDETNERFCRCDVTNGYYPYSHPDDHPSDGCSFYDYECSNDPPKCIQGEQLLLNYTCATSCKEGFYKNETSGDCVPNPTTLISTKSNVGLPSFSPTVSAIKTSTSTQAPKSTTVSHRLDEGVVIGVGIAVLVLIVVLIVILRVIYKRKQNYSPVSVSLPANESPTYNQDSSSNRNETDNTDSRIQFIIQGDYIHANADNIQISRDDSGNRLVESNSEATISRSRASTSDSFKPSRKDSKDQIATAEIPLGFKRTQLEECADPTQTHSLDRKRKPSLRALESVNKSYRKIPKEHTLDVKNRLNLSDREYEVFVPKVLMNSQAELVKYLHVDTLIDEIAKSEMFVHTDLRDITEEKTTSDKIRQLLRRLKEKGVDSYIPFKGSLINSKQEASLDILENQELIVYKKIMAKRKPNVKTGSGISDEESSGSDEERSFLAIQKRTSYSSSDGFEQVTTTADIETINDITECLNSADGGSLVDEKE